MRHLLAAALVGCVLTAAQPAYSGRMQSEDDALYLPAGPAERRAYRKGQELAERGDHAAAVAEYSKAIALQPNFAAAISLRGFAYLELGDYPRAIADHDAVVMLASRSANAWGNACWARAVANTDLDTALELCDLAVKMPAGRPQHYDTRGFVRFRRGEFALAVGDYGKAIAADKDWASSLFMRGVCRLRLGEEAAGREDIAAALKIDPKIAETYRRRGVELSPKPS